MVDITQAIDPRAAHDRWVREHEWHLNLVPSIIDAIVEATLPTIPVSRAGSRFDKDQITGGGYIDSLTALNHFDVINGRIEPTGAAADARELWTELVEYHHAATTAVLSPSRPPLALPASPNPDPLTARSTALLTVGWLIDHGEQIAEAPTLTREPGDLFELIRRLRGRYGVFNAPRRRPPERCTICGEVEVRAHWVTGLVGPRSVEVKTCRTCGNETREQEPGDVCRSTGCVTATVHDHGPACSAGCEHRIEGETA